MQLAEVERPAWPPNCGLLRDRIRGYPPVPFLDDEAQFQASKMRTEAAVRPTPECEVIVPSLVDDVGIGVACGVAVGGSQPKPAV
jgi:hypothetical protein